MAHNHESLTVRSTEINLDEEDVGCIFEGDAVKLKNDLISSIDAIVAKTSGDGCIAASLVESLLILMRSDVEKAVRKSRQTRQSVTAAADAATPQQPIAIHHGLMRRFLERVGQQVQQALANSADGTKCIESEQVAVLKVAVRQLVDNPPTMPPGEALALYRRWVEKRYSRLTEDDDVEVVDY